MRAPALMNRRTDTHVSPCRVFCMCDLFLLFKGTGSSVVQCLWGVFVWGFGVLFLSCACVCRYRGCCSLSVCVCVCVCVCVTC